MKTPIDYKNSIVFIEETEHVIYKVLIKDTFTAYKLSYIEFSDYVIEHKDLIFVEPYEEDKTFCFKLTKAKLKRIENNPWIYLYNTKTKRYECYQ